MIKKLDLEKRNSFGTLDWLANINEPSGAKLIEEKINELVDAVNGLQKKYDNVCVWVGEQKLNYNPDTTKGLSTLVEEPEPTDPYAEQRKWIGKLCRFWNKTEYTDDLYGFLTDIVPTNKYKAEDNYFVPFKDEFGSFYEHCEPVKPDDNIIYKGE